MKCVLRASLAVVCLISAGSSVSGQSLSQRLKTESAATLASAAREQGNAVRGAILFPQQKLGCANCHAPGSNNLLGPDLTRLGSEVSDTSLVESILEPSRAIRKGFETVTVITDAGKAIIGRIIEQDSDKLVLRESSPDRRLITLAKSDIEKIVPNQTSGMPDKLADQLKDRQQFLDLVRYMMEIVSAEQARVPRQTHSLGGGTVSEELQGLVLLNEFNCSACHQDDHAPSVLSVKRAPKLEWFGGRINPNFIRRFIADPLKVKHGSTMPDVMTKLSADERHRAADEITHYLVSLSDRPFTTQPVDRVAAKRGRELFHSVGCVACHSPRDDAGQELLADKSVPLGLVEDKYNVDGLVDFLKNPHEVRSAGRMPNMQLTHWEALDIAHYLLSRAKDNAAIETSFQLDPDLVESGKTRFQRLGCVRCHGKNETASEPTSLPLAQAHLDRGCLSGEAGAWPRFSLSDSQRKAIRAALGRESGNLNDQEQIAVTLTAFRCLNCHQRDELGGVPPERNPHFQTTNPNLGPQGRVPPTLTGVGAKLKPKWMRQVLVSGRLIRPYIKTRMPQFGTENVAHLVDLFQRVDRLPDVTFARFSDQKEMRTAGSEMAGTGGLNCIACHTFQLKAAATMPAVDLTEMAERLHQSWFYHYMRDPQRLSMNTVMPSFWPGGRAMRKDILNGETDQQIEALWQYLLDGRQARTPRGLIRVPMELLATNEAVMLRRSYPGIGKRGIGVGYPHQVNLAFDAEQMRLAMIWKGKFADPGGVWRSQGHGTVRPLGSNLIRFASGPDLDDANTPWTAEDVRPLHHRFRGYSLDDQRRPKFTYQFGDIIVEDYSVDVLDPKTNQSFLRRTLTLQSEQERRNVTFRAASGKNIVATGDATFLVDNMLRVRIDEKHAGQLVDTPSGQQLRIPLIIPRGTSSLVIEYVW
jgi:putative heme-binding domain-containing protein